jgi:hypothetical protein
MAMARRDPSTTFPDQNHANEGEELSHGDRPAEGFAANLPQWQGLDRPNYRIGGRVLAAIAPGPQGPGETVIVPHAVEDDRSVDGGIASR